MTVKIQEVEESRRNIAEICGVREENILRMLKLLLKTRGAGDLLTKYCLLRLDWKKKEKNRRCQEINI